MQKAMFIMMGSMMMAAISPGCAANSRSMAGRLLNGATSVASVVPLSTPALDTTGVGAPGGMHLCLHRKMTGEVVIRTPTTPATLFVPSVGVMMASVLNVYGADTIGVLMTGIGDDGADSMVAIKQAGGH